MAQEQSTATLPEVAVRRSLSDRPAAVRYGISTLHFIKTKPLGAFGALVIAIVVFFGFMTMPILPSSFAEFVERVPPDEEVRGERAVCTPEQVEDFSVECFSQELFDRSQVDATVRVLYPPSRFEAGGAEGAILLLASPSWDHWLGTDLRGRDVWSRVVHGARLALLVGIGAALIAVTFGTLFGIVSAYFGGWVDMVIQRITDAFYAFPSLILLLIFAQVIENPNKYTTTVALGIIGVASVVRIARASVLATREEMYVMAAQTVGASDRRIMLRHILPNIVAPLIVVFTISVGAYILAEAGLAFLGLGDPVAISWGKMINEGRGLGPANPGLALYVGTALTLTVLGFNLLGDALRDVLDPRLRGRGGRAGF
jgi:peptide/nickel transport system permease protein